MEKLRLNFSERPAAVLCAQIFVDVCGEIWHALALWLECGTDIYKTHFVATSVTRFGKILPLLQKNKSLANFCWQFIFWPNIEPALVHFITIGRFYFLQMAKYLTNNLAILSHWLLVKWLVFVLEPLVESQSQNNNRQNLFPSEWLFRSSKFDVIFSLLVSL